MLWRERLLAVQREEAPGSRVLDQGDPLPSGASVLGHPSPTELSSRTLRYLTGQLRARHREIGTHPRRLPVGRQALLALAHLGRGAPMPSSPRGSASGSRPCTATGIHPQCSGLPAGGEAEAAQPFPAIGEAGSWWTRPIWRRSAASSCRNATPPHPCPRGCGALQRARGDRIQGRRGGDRRQCRRGIPGAAGAVAARGEAASQTRNRVSERDKKLGKRTRRAGPPPSRTRPLHFRRHIA